LASDSVSEIDETHQKTIYTTRWCSLAHSFCPSSVLALAGIPYYGYNVWGCHISVPPFSPTYIPRTIFLTAPVALVILVVTINMILVYLAVRKQAARAARWRFPESDPRGDFTVSTGSTINVNDNFTRRRSGNRRSGSTPASRLERDVFWQSLFYLGAYYLTWPCCRSILAS
jgi:hypothetical protein